MSEEEKEAIENIKALKILFEIDDKKDFEATPLVQKEMAKDLRTLLNLIEKLLKENEQLKKQVQRQINKWNKDIKSNYISKHEVKDKNMSEEEKEAIEYLKTRLYGNEGCKYIDVAQEDLRIFINLIDRLQNKKCEPEFDMEKLQKENEQLKKITINV